MPYVQVNDIQMYYEIHGDGEPLVLIVGLGTDISEWDGIIRWLAQTYKVLAFDNRGAGRTDKPDTRYSIEMMAHDTAGLMQTLGIQQAHILGISMGGRIALALSLRYPESVKKLVLVSTSIKAHFVYFIHLFFRPFSGILLSKGS
jgi:3-oxoadipate enol-lactonase